MQKEERKEKMVKLYVMHGVKHFSFAKQKEKFRIVKKCFL